MSITVLIDSPAFRARIAAVRAFAEKPEHRYRPGSGATPPGEDPRFVAELPRLLRCVFSVTLSADGRLHRHLSVSKEGGYASPPVVFTLASWFGFTGAQPDDVGVVHDPPPSWALGIIETERCVVVAQPLELLQ